MTQQKNINNKKLICDMTGEEIGLPSITITKEDIAKQIKHIVDNPTINKLNLFIVGNEETITDHYQFFKEIGSNNNLELIYVDTSSSNSIVEKQLKNIDFNKSLIVLQNLENMSKGIQQILFPIPHVSNKEKNIVILQNENTVGNVDPFFIRLALYVYGESSTSENNIKKNITNLRNNLQSIEKEASLKLNK